MIAQSSKLKAKNISLKSLFFIFQLSVFSLQSSASYAESELGSVEMLFLGGKYEKAMDEAGRLIDARARQRDELYYIKGLSELKTGRFKEARQSFEKILSKYQRSARAFDAHIGIGDSYLLENDPGQALKSYKETLDKFPDDKNRSMLLHRIEKCGSAKSYPAFSEKAGLWFDYAHHPSRTIPSEVEGEAPENGGNISVQVGSFRDKKNADRLNRKLSQAGYDSYIETAADLGEKMYRVRVGRLKSQEEARSLESRLKQEGYKTKICGNILCD